jgi:ribonuclease P protein component
LTPTDLSLPRGARITKGREVRRGFDNGRSAASGPVVVYAFDRGDGRPPRFALVVGRKWGDAVRRNRQRRLLREAFRTSRPELPAGFDLVLVPRSSLMSLAMADVRTALRDAADRASKRFAAEGPATGGRSR